MTARFLLVSMFKVQIELLPLYQRLQGNNPDEWRDDFSRLKPDLILERATMRIQMIINKDHKSLLFSSYQMVKKLLWILKE